MQKNAYLALQNVEQSTVNSVCYFEPYMKIKEADKYFYIHAIKGAIEGEQLRLLYQPKIDLNTNKIVGVEALTRWHHPERGVISPGDFISAAEESGQIVDITKWAINQACSDMAQWRKADIEDISVAINVSLVDFRSGALPQIIFKALNTNQISPHLLELEITESVIFDDADHVQEQIHKMNVKGVSFAIDDFGTGYSNLGYLSKFNVETLKIDQSFLKDIATNFHNQHIVKSIIKMSKSLHIENVAEGVEDEETAKWLRENDCSMAQGYHWAKPMAFNELVKFLEKNNSH
ncbi:hypothetical protein GCM10017161_38080 [Thalassotalea marina]|uniref:EAL domain-containing protein n=2 Tax=Thalassotalea marina TaxID=1673741 RepID=A0A919BP15_9GAMM|nr:hypothetical protein GCM10017161_38080 [Thalassotalea marina]